MNPPLTVGGQYWDFGDVSAVERRLGPEPGFTGGFPTRWRLFGPTEEDSTQVIGTAYDHSTGRVAQPRVNADVEQIRELPGELRIGDESFVGKDREIEAGTLDFSEIYGTAAGATGHQAYAFTEFETNEATDVILGAGGGWWMQWWIDGVEVLNTLPTGNMLAPLDPTNHCARQKLDAGRHLLVVRSISGRKWHKGVVYDRWMVKADFVNAEAELMGSRRIDQWEVFPDQDLVRSPKAVLEPGVAIRTDLCVADETVECDFVLHSAEGQFGLIFGAQDSGHFYWAYHPRWGQNWRARAFYAIIARVDGTDHATGLAMMLMPNVPAHEGYRLSMKVERQGNHIQMYVNGVKGPFVVDDTYGPGRSGFMGYTDFEVHNFKVDGITIPPSTWRKVERERLWFNPTQDTGYGSIRDVFALLKLEDGDLVAGINSRSSEFHGHDPNMKLQLYLSSDAGRSWRRHGDLVPTGQVPFCHPWGIR